MNCGGCNHEIPKGHHYCDRCGFTPKAQVMPETHLCACGCGKPGTISNAQDGKGKWWTGECWRKLRLTKVNEQTAKQHLTQIKGIIEKTAVR